MVERGCFPGVALPRLSQPGAAGDEGHDAHPPVPPKTCLCLAWPDVQEEKQYISSQGKGKGGT